MEQKSNIPEGQVVQKPKEATVADESSGLADRLRFDRVEFAGSLGDLGTLLPIVVAMILINKLSPAQCFSSSGCFISSQAITTACLFLYSLSKLSAQSPSPILS